MRAEQEFFEALTGAAGVTALVAQRIYPDVATEGALPPLIVYERRSSEPVHTIHDGATVASKVSVAANAWALTRMAAEALGDAIETAMASTGISVNRFGHYDAQKGAYASVIDFEIWELP